MCLGCPAGLPGSSASMVEVSVCIHNGRSMAFLTYRSDGKALLDVGLILDGLGNIHRVSSGP